MTAYPPPLFSFSTLKFNSLIYEVADTVTAVASSIVNALSIITNKIYTYDTALTRELWTDSSLTSIILGNQTANIELGNYDVKANGEITCFNTLTPINLFNTNYAMSISNNSNYTTLSHGQIAGDLLYLGNQLNTNVIGGFQLIDQTLTALVPTNPVNLFNTNTTGSISLGTGLSLFQSLTLGNSSCIINFGAFSVSSNAWATTSPTVNVNLFGNLTSGTLSLSLGQTAGTTTTIGNSVNTNKVGNFNFIGNGITSSSAITNVTLFNNLTDGGIVIGNAIGLGNVTIANNQLISASVNIGSAVGKVKCSNITMQGNTIAGSATNSTIGLFGENTNGTINMGINQIAGGNVVIGNSAGIVTLGDQFKFSGSSLTSQAIGSAITLFNNITTGSGTIFNGLTTGSLNIMNAMTTGFCNIGGTAVSTGGLRLYNAITMGYTTLVLPTSNQVGYVTGNLSSTTGNVTLPTANVISNYSTFSLPTGVWIASVSLAQITVSAGSYVNFYLADATLGSSSRNWSGPTSGTSNPSMLIVATLTNTTSSPVTKWLTAVSGITNFIVGTGSVILTRIA